MSVYTVAGIMLIANSVLLVIVAECLKRTKHELRAAEASRVMRGKLNDYYRKRIRELEQKE